MGGPGLAAQFSSLLGASLNSFAQQFQPSETINTGEVMRYRNSILGQAEYSFSRRSAFTFSGSYGLLHFAGTGYFNSTMVDAQAGYDYLLDPSNSIAILASYGKIDSRAPGFPRLGPPRLGTGTPAGLCGRAGLRKENHRPPGIPGCRGAAGNSIYRPRWGRKFPSLFVSVNSALTYERRRSGVSLQLCARADAGDRACSWERRAIHFPARRTINSRASGRDPSTAGTH